MIVIIYERIYNLILCAVLRISNIKPFIIIVFIYGIIDSNKEFKYRI